MEKMFDVCLLTAGRIVLSTADTIVQSIISGVDKRGKTVDFLLRPDRGIAAVQAFFRKALATSLPRWPRKIALDRHAPSHQALRPRRWENPKWKYVLVRKCPYLNNIVEQDHRA